MIELDLHTDGDSKAAENLTLILKEIGDNALVSRVGPYLERKNKIINVVSTITEINMIEVLFQIVRQHIKTSVVKQAFPLKVKTYVLNILFTKIKLIMREIQ